MINPYLYPNDTNIIPNPDISGIGVRYAIYAQSLLNHFVALSEHDSEQAIAINVVNTIALSAIAVASGYAEVPDWPHLIIIYHFVLLIYFSNITYNTIPSELRQSEKFGPLMERLTVLELFANPLFIIITSALWIGLILSRKRKAQFPRTECTFGNWVVLGRTVDLGTSQWVYVGLAIGMFWIAVYLFATTINTLARRKTVRKVKDAVHRTYGPDPPVAQRQLPEDCNVRITGDCLSALVWKRAPQFLRDGYRIWPVTLSLRFFTFLWRFGLWLYLVIENEALIPANNLYDENTWTYGQMSALILLIVPTGVLWDMCYRQWAGFRQYFDSHQGQYYLLYLFGGSLAGVWSAAAYGLAGASWLGLALYASVGFPFLESLLSGPTIPQVSINSSAM